MAHNGLEAKQIPAAEMQQPLASGVMTVVLAHNGLEAKQMPAAEIQQPLTTSLGV